MHRLAFVSLVVAVHSSAPALAEALVEVQSDRISVIRGNGFQQVAGITPVKPGDLVMASDDGGHGWSPDCNVEVLPGKVYTVEDRPGEVRDAKASIPACKKPVPIWLSAAGVGLLNFGGLPTIVGEGKPVSCSLSALL
jgi:hypothetical protein